MYVATRRFRCRQDSRKCDGVHPIVCEQTDERVLLASTPRQMREWNVDMLQHACSCACSCSYSAAADAAVAAAAAAAAVAAAVAVVLVLTLSVTIPHWVVL